MAEFTFKFFVEAVLMPVLSLFGIIGNMASIGVLHDRDVKLKKDFVEVLSALACFDIFFLACTFFLFSMPEWSVGYEESVYPYLVPILFPATNTFMTASIYMTVAVAVNRYLDMRIVSSNEILPRINSGITQAGIVFTAAAVFNIPRWFEFAYGYEIRPRNVTLEMDGDGEVQYKVVNESVLTLGVTELRENKSYIRNYTLIANTVCVLLLPTAIMLISSVMLLMLMIRRQPTTQIHTSDQERARKKRNRSITLMLFGIILCFFVCHIGEVIISLYEMIVYIEHSEKAEFSTWARNLIVINHLLIVSNSSLNFVIYSSDLVFRQCVKKST